MSARIRAFGAVARLDFAEVMRSRWLVFTLAIYALLAAVFVLVGLRESTVVDFTGSGRVLLSFSHSLVLLLPLLALTATGQIVNGARASGSLELLLSQPITRSDYFAAVSFVRYAILVGPLIVLTIGVGMFGHFALGQTIPWAFVARALACGASLLFAFVGVGMLVTVLTQSQAKAMIAVLVLWLASVALLDFALAGLMLEWHVPARFVFVLASLNPVEAARLALLSSAEPQLATLGPVGFYLANQLGARALFAIGIAWPTLVGFGCWSLAGWSFRRGDAV